MDHMVLLVAVSAFFSSSDYLIGLNLMNLKLARAINVTQNVLGCSSCTSPVRYTVKLCRRSSEVIVMDMLNSNI